MSTMAEMSSIEQHQRIFFSTDYCLLTTVYCFSYFPCVRYDAGGMGAASAFPVADNEWRATEA